MKVRYRGLVKNTAQLHTLFALSSLWMVRRRLLQGLRAWARLQAAEGLPELRKRVVQTQKLR